MNENVPKNKFIYLSGELLNEILFWTQQPRTVDALETLIGDDWIKVLLSTDR